jgi:pimeloyl-ACP methyl ester carboxylesterase
MSSRQTRVAALSPVAVVTAEATGAIQWSPSRADGRGPEQVKQSYIQLGQQSIAYYQTAGAGRPIVLVHGNSSSSKVWRNQLEGPLGAKYRLIAFDLPGHGNSGRAGAPDRDYSLVGYAKTMADFADNMDLEGAIFVGWSLGGHAVLEAAAELSRASGLMILGSPPVSKAEDGFAGFKGLLPAAFMPTPSDAEIDTFVEHLFAPHFSPIPEFFAADFRNTDAAARSYLGESVPSGLYKDEISIVRELKLPLAIVCGAEEQIVDLNYLTRLEAPGLWRHEVQIIGSAGHAAQWEQPQAFSKLIDDFASSI